MPVILASTSSTVTMKGLFVEHSIIVMVYINGHLHVLIVIKRNRKQSNYHV